MDQLKIIERKEMMMTIKLKNQRNQNEIFY